MIDMRKADCEVMFGDDLLSLVISVRKEGKRDSADPWLASESNPQPFPSRRRDY
jgi:hypothetical protein